MHLMPAATRLVRVSGTGTKHRPAQQAASCHFCSNERDNIKAGPQETLDLFLEHQPRGLLSAVYYTMDAPAAGG